MDWKQVVILKFRKSNSSKNLNYGLLGYNAIVLQMEHFYLEDVGHSFLQNIGHNLQVKHDSDVKPWGYIWQRKPE